MIKKGLGKGLGALISSADTEGNGVRELRLNEIEPNTDQPRKSFNDEKLLQLADSIKQHGIVQPIIVKKDNEVYRIVAGERRWRAARIAGMTTVPAIVKELSSKQVMELALIENLQREDLGPLEEAEAFEKLIREYGMTQEEISKTIGRSRPAIANSLRLLHLGQKVKQMLESNEITSGHARTLLGIEDSEVQLKIAREIADRGLNVREAEKLVKRLLSKRSVPKKVANTAELMEIEEKFKVIFGTKVKLISNRKKGKIVIEYYSPDELERLLELVENIKK